MTNGRRWLIGALLTATICGCSAATRYLWRQPTIALRAVRLGGIGLNGGTLRVSLLVRNPNFYPLSTVGMRYRLLVRDSVVIAESADSTRRRVAAKDSVVLELPVHVTWNGISAAGRDIMSSGLVEYRILGDITLDTPVGTHDVPVNQTGRFAPLR